MSDGVLSISGPLRPAICNEADKHMSNIKLKINKIGEGVINASTGSVPEFDPDVPAVQTPTLEEKLTMPPRGKNPFEKYTNRGRASQLLKRAMRKMDLFGRVGSTG